MSHLTHDELVRWRDAGPAADRERVLTHMAACEACRKEYAAMVRERSPAEPAAVSQELLARGYAAYRAPRAASWWRSPPLLVGLPLAAAAVLAVILLPSARVPVLDRPADVQVRGSEIQLIAPVGRVATATSFRWSSPVAAGRFRLAVRDEKGAVVYEATSGLEEAAAPPALQASLRPGVRYSWTVDALDSTGEVLARSVPQTFTVTPPAR
jgi:hypothetical protein